MVQNHLVSIRCGFLSWESFTSGGRLGQSNSQTRRSLEAAFPSKAVQSPPWLNREASRRTAFELKPVFPAISPAFTWSCSNCKASARWRTLRPAQGFRDTNDVSTICSALMEIDAGTVPRVLGEN